jgi:threonine dehydratase
MITKTIIEEAHERIRPWIHRTPIMSSELINEEVACEVLFKCENFQKAGAFKSRGASNAVFSLTEEEMTHGVATHSSGNHAGALALAAKRRNIPAYIVMPENAPLVKVAAVESYGGDISFCTPTLEARESTLASIIAKKGAYEIHPYDNERIIAGQATACKELIEDTEKLDFIIAPVGGGGLLSGTLLSAKYFSPETKVIAAEPEGADDAFRSLEEGKLIPSINPNTIADGLLTSLGNLNYPIIKEHIHKIFTVSDKEISDAMRLVWERMKIIIEPSSATCLAVIIKNKELFKNKRIGVIISGGNVDLNKLPF